MIRTVNLADELAAGRSFPVRDFRVALNHASAVALLKARRSFWLDAASGYADLAEAGCSESLGDAVDCLAEADRYAA